MSKMRLGLCTIGAVLASFAATEPTAAFEYAGQAWCCDTVCFLVNSANPSTACGNPVMGQWFRAYIDQVAGTYNARHTVYQLIDKGTTTVACSSSSSPAVCLGRKDGQNTVAMAKACNWIDDNILAYSTWWYWTGGDSAGCISESDVCFNDDVMWFNNNPPCSGNCYDLISLALHELGHWIALNHEPHNTTLGYKPVMYPFFNYCEQRRALTADDIAGLKWAYDSVGAIALPQRTAIQHLHPADPGYNTPPAHDTCPGFVAPCDCPHQGDINQDSFINVLDVVAVINRVFKGAAAVKDPLCPRERADFNADGAINVLDVTGEINHVFKHGPLPVNPCGP